MTNDQIRAHIAAGKTSRELGEMLGLSHRQVLKYAAKHNLGPWMSASTKLSRAMERPIPEDFGMIAAKLPMMELLKHYNCAWETGRRWYREANVKPIKARVTSSRAKPIPDDFAEMAPSRSLTALTAIYPHLSRDTIARMKRKLGIKSAPSFKQIHDSRGPLTLSRTLAHQVRWQATPTLGHGEEAARYLQGSRGGGWTVYRCTEDGAQKVEGKFWRVGRMVMADAEVEAMAVRKGYRAGAWKELAA